MVTNDMSVTTRHAGASAAGTREARNSSPRTRRFALFAWLVLAYNIPVILWGAYVRVSFSGDGCGANWPFCKGQLLPQHMSTPTMIELTHRLMTGADTVAVVLLCVLAFLLYPKQHAVRRYSVLSLVFLFIEALLGAGLVLFRLVARDQSAGRAVYLSLHLTNTMLLLAALAITAWLAHRSIEKLRLQLMSRRMAAALVVTIAVAITGAVTALGDTLFPAASVAAGLQQDMASTSSFLLRLRVVHPAIATAGAAYLLWVAGSILKRGTAINRTIAERVVSVVVLQLALGVVNIALRAPLWMQLTHLLVADLLWIAVVIMAVGEAASLENFEIHAHAL